MKKLRGNITGVSKAIRKDGTINYKFRRLPFFKRLEIHYLLLSIPWAGLAGVVFSIYLITNTIFTILFLYSGATGYPAQNF